MIYKIRRWNSDEQQVNLTDVSLEQIVNNPVGLNMADVGLILLNKLRVEKGLPELPKDSMAGWDDL